MDHIVLPPGCIIKQGGDNMIWLKRLAKLSARQLWPGVSARASARSAAAAGGRLRLFLQAASLRKWKALHGVHRLAKRYCNPTVTNDRRTARGTAASRRPADIDAAVLRPRPRASGRLLNRRLLFDAADFTPHTLRRDWHPRQRETTASLVTCRLPRTAIGLRSQSPAARPNAFTQVPRRGPQLTAELSDTQLLRSLRRSFLACSRHAEPSRAARRRVRGRRRGRPSSLASRGRGRPGCGRAS